MKIDAEGRLLVVTGANMGGKSTLLRSVRCLREIVKNFAMASKCCLEDFEGRGLVSRHQFLVSGHHL